MNEQNKDGQGRHNLSDLAKHVHSNQGISLAEKIKEELAHIQFTGQEQVLSRTHPKKLTDRLRNLWNKELEIPVLPLLAVAFLLIIGVGLYDFPVDHASLHGGLTEKRELVDTGVGIYWSDVLERAVSRK